MLAAQPPQLTAPDLVAQLEKHFKEAPGYLWEGEMVIGVREGGDAFKLVSQAKLRMAGATGGKSFFRLEPLGKDPHLLISDGQKSWAYVPKLKQYTESEAATVAAGESAEADDAGAEIEPAQTYADLLWPALTHLAASRDFSHRD